jgi:hypothetical protein
MKIPRMPRMMVLVGSYFVATVSIAELGWLMSRMYAKSSLHDKMRRTVMPSEYIPGTA